MRIDSMKFAAFAALVMLLAGHAGAQESAQPAPGQQLAHWFNEAASAYNGGNDEDWVEATEQLHRLRPYNQDFMRHLVQGYARTDQLRKAFDMMLKMQQQGLAEDWDSIDDVAPMRQHNLYEHLSQLMTQAGEPFGEASIWSSLEADKAMPEAMAHDAESGRIFVGTVRDGLILTTRDGESWERFAGPVEVAELQAVFDLAVDAERGHLWVASGRIPHFQGPEREDGVRSSLLRLDLETGELEREYPLSEGSGRNLLGSLAIAADGAVFAADTQAPVIHRLEPGSDSIEPYFAHQNFTSLRGIALSGDQRLLYVADYETGIFIINAQEREQAWKLAVPDSLNVGGIDGLFWWNDHLVAIQNGISPQRVVRLALGDDGLGVTSVAPIVAAHEEFDTPTFGVMNGQELFFLGGSHWHHVDPQGRSSKPLPEVKVMKTDVDASQVQVVGQEVLEQLRRQNQ